MGEESKPSLAEGTVVAGRYTIKQRLGAGGLGEVYLAMSQFGGQVALKILNAETRENDIAKERFLRESRAAASTNSPYVVQVADAGDDHTCGPYLVMELLRGEDLQHRLEKQPIPPLNEVIRIVLCILDALVDTHRAGVVHRDLKPENVFLTAQKRGPDQVKLMDFGMAGMADGNRVERLTKTQAGAFGTPYYMPWEQWQNITDVDHRADLYAVAVILYEMTEGVLPHQGSLVELCAAISSGTPRPMERADPVLAAIVAKGMAKDREERYPDAAKFAQALEAYVESHGLMTTPSASLVPPAPTPTPTPVIENVPPNPPSPPPSAIETHTGITLERIGIRPARPNLLTLALGTGLLALVALVLGVALLRTPSPSTRPNPRPTAVVAVPTPVVTPVVMPPTPVIITPPEAPQVVVTQPPPTPRVVATRHGRDRTRNVRTAPRGPTPQVPIPNGPAPRPTTQCRSGPDGENICD